jgi:very-short-patch-repair endonuclease
MRTVSRPSPHAHRARLLAERAQALRQFPTVSERKLWLELRGGKLGVAFKRQVPLGRWIADFFAPAIGLVVEVDGGIHAFREQADARRDEGLRRLGYTVIRLDAELVMRQLPRAVALVREGIAALLG